MGQKQLAPTGPGFRSGQVLKLVWQENPSESVLLVGFRELLSPCENPKANEIKIIIKTRIIIAEMEQPSELEAARGWPPGGKMVGVTGLGLTRLKEGELTLL